MTQPPPTSRSAHPILAAVASAILPGAGQLIAGDRRRAVRLLIIDAVLLGIIVIFFRDKVAILTAFVKPTTLASMMLANILLLAYRIWAADDAYRIAADGRDAGVPGRVGAVAVIALAFVLVTPHLVFGYYDVVQYKLITSVFGGNSSIVAGPTTTTSIPTTSPSATPSTTPDGGTVATTPTTSTTTATTLPDTDGKKLWDGLDRLNILLLGGDFGIGRTGVRTDTMITVSIDPKTGQTAMFSIPRNWTYAPLPEGMGKWDCNCYPELINELWEMGRRYPDAFPGPEDPSVNAVKGVVSEFLGIPINYYALVNLDGFVDIIDALGGVDIYVPQRIVDDAYPYLDGSIGKLVIEPGMHHMDGVHALEYARTRHQDSDYFRMNRQRCVLEAVLNQVKPTQLLLNFQKLADVLKNSMQTDIPLDALPQLVELLPKVDRDNIVSVRFIPPTYHLKFRPDGKPGRIANIPLVHEHVQLVLNDPERAVKELGLDTLNDVCPQPPNA